MSPVHLLPQRTTSPVARRLHAMLRYCPGYQEASESRSRVAWVLDAVKQLPYRDDLPVGYMDAVCELQAVDLVPRWTQHLTVDQLCKLIVEAGRYCAYRNVVEEEFSRERARSRTR